MSDLPYNGPYSYLISRRLLEECEQWGAEKWREYVHLMSPAHREYPDGSLEVFLDLLGLKKTEPIVGPMHDLLLSMVRACIAKRKAEGGPSGSAGSETHFRSVLANPLRLYMLWYPDALQRGIGDRRLLVGPNCWTEISENEREPDRLNITILMVKKPDDQCRRYVAGMIGGWYASVARSGVFGEGPVKPAQDYIEWHGRAAVFTADFSASGQGTLNWLVLWLVNHSDRWPIEEIHLGRPGWLDIAGLRKKKPVREKLSFNLEEFVALRAACVDEWKSGLEIEVIQQPSFQPERGCIEIVFSEPADDARRKEIDEALRAWLVIGMHGGWGGHVAYYSEPEWGPEKDTLVVMLDFGTSDLEQSLAVLKRILENISREVHRIETVTLK